MHHYILYPLLFWLTGLSLLAGVTSQAVQPGYTIIASKENSALKAGEAEIEFHFFDDQGRKTDAELLVYFNHTEVHLIPDTNGMARHKISAGNYHLRFDLYHPYPSVPMADIIPPNDSIALKSGFLTIVNIVLPPAPTMIIKKPVLYFYPEKKSLISLKFEPEGELLFSYPKYSGEWRFEADDNGLILMNGNAYRYLFWEARNSIKAEHLNFSTAYSMPTAELTNFLETQLSFFGFNSTEQQDFITYWVPQIQAYPFCRIQFLLNEQCDAIAQYSIQPTPEQFTRLYMLWTGDDQATAAATPTNKIKIVRKGFNVLEWGGAEVSLPKQNP